MKHARDSYKHIQDSSGKIPVDEPVFFLRAQDPVAAEVVRYWALLTADKGGDPAIVALANFQARAMDQWPIKKRVADMPQGDQLSFKFRDVDSGEELQEVETDEEGDEAQKWTSDHRRTFGDDAAAESVQNARDCAEERRGEEELRDDDDDDDDLAGVANND